MEAEARLGRESKLSTFSASAPPQVLMPCLDAVSDSMFSGYTTGFVEVSDSTEIASELFGDPVETLMSSASWVPVVPDFDDLREEGSIGRSTESESCVGAGEHMDEYSDCWDQVLDLVSLPSVSLPLY